MVTKEIMPTGASLNAQTPEKKPTPEVGQTFTLAFNPWSGLCEVYGDNYQKGATYVEVEVKAVKTAKINLE